MGLVIIVYNYVPMYLFFMSALFLFMNYDELRTAGTIFIDIAPKDTLNS